MLRGDFFVFPLDNGTPVCYSEGMRSSAIDHSLPPRFQEDIRMEKIEIHEAELRLMELVWDNAPIRSTALVRLAGE